MSKKTSPPACDRRVDEIVELSGVDIPTNSTTKPCSAIARSNSLADLAARINAEHEATGAALKRGYVHAVTAGELLVEAKAKIPHGQWLSWLAANCTVKPRTATLYMRLFRCRPAIEEIGNVADLTVRNALSRVEISRSHSEIVDDAEHTFDEAESFLQMAKELSQNHDAAAVAVVLTDEFCRMAAAVRTALDELLRIVDLIDVPPTLARVTSSRPAGICVEIRMRSEFFAGALLNALERHGP
jgi:hypothetical protein